MKDSPSSNRIDPRLQVMMFWEYAIKGLWFPLASVFLSATIAEGGPRRFFRRQLFKEPHIIFPDLSISRYGNLCGKASDGSLTGFGSVRVGTRGL